MNILVTVGSSGFNELIQMVDRSLVGSGHRITCQIANGPYEPKSFDFFRFSETFSDICQSADLVICHGGAGTVFELLEMRKKILVVPNRKRSDKHQIDLASYIAKQKLGAVCWKLEQLPHVLFECINTQYAVYKKDEFFYEKDVLRFFALAT